VLIVEGASDTAALLGAGINAIGRPSNSSGAQFAAQLVGKLPEGTPIIVMGENDQKPDGRWPGKEGAEKVAQEMANALPTYKVHIAYPPDGVKDVRAWFAGRSGVEVGEAFLGSLTWERTFPCLPQSKGRDDKEEIAADTRPVAVLPAVAESDVQRLLAGLHRAPPPWRCPHGGSSLLNDVEHPSRYRAIRHACDCWHCTVCRMRLARSWAKHIACCVLAATSASEGRTLYVREVADASREWSALSRQLNRYDVPWAALEIAPGRLLIVMACRGDFVPSGGLPCTVEQIGGRLVEWARTVRTWPEPLAHKLLRTRPVRTSKHWKLEPPEKSGRWKWVAKLDASKSDTVIETLAAHGIKPTRVEDAVYYTCDPRLGRSCAWCVEFRVKPDRAAESISALVDAMDPLPFVAKREEEPIPW
jgi:hypothetical protein